MKKIYKYPLGLKANEYGPVTLQLPKGSRIIPKAGVQHNQIFLWAEVDTDAPLEAVTILVVGTGHDVPEGCEYLDTAQIPPFVWHIYIQQ